MLDIVSEQYKSDVEYHSMLEIVSEQYKSDVKYCSVVDIVSELNKSDFKSTNYTNKHPIDGHVIDQIWPMKLPYTKSLVDITFNFSSWHYIQMILVACNVMDEFFY